MVKAFALNIGIFVVAIDATSAMDRNGSVQELGAVAEAKQVLEQILANGRVPANECKRQIRESSGITSETSLSRARKELGIKVRREGFGAGGVWYWELAAKDSTRAREDLCRKCGKPLPEALVSIGLHYDCTLPYKED